MAVLIKRTVVTIPGIAVRSIVFFGCLYLYVWLRIEPELIYHSFGYFINLPAYSVGWASFMGFACYPGGTVEYLSSILSQLFYFSWLGAFIITLVAWGICFCTAELIKLYGGRQSGLLCYIPALLLVIMYNQYKHPLDIGSALLISLLFSLFYEKIHIHSKIASTAVFLIFFIILYHLVGLTSLLFVIITGIYRIFIQQRVVSGLLHFPLAFLAIWLIGIYLSELPITDAYLRLSPLNQNIKISAGSVVPWCLYLFIPLALTAVLLWERLFKKKFHGNYKIKKVFQATKLTALVFISLVSVYFSFDSYSKYANRLTYFERHKMWPQMLEYIRKNPIDIYNHTFNHYTNKALYHTAQLGDNMFWYPQKPSSLLLNPKKFGISSREFTGGQVFMELGHLNLAEKKTFEALINLGDHPVILKRLALISIAKGLTETARFYLSALSKDLIYGPQAKDLLHRLEKNPLLTGDEEIEHLRSVMVVKDGFVADRRAEPILLKLLESNRHNRMAFEYLMAYYMLNGKLEKFVNNIYRLDDFNYQHIPRHYEETLSLYTNITGKKVDLHGRRIRNETLERFEKFKDIYTSYENKYAAANVMMTEFGSSYFFYYTFYGTVIPK